NLTLSLVFASAESTASATVATPSCACCRSALVQRRNRRTGENFLGCSQFPKCRGTA
ncbi:topoisomerase DNA-binding C4 zinc finger domain-containing protein, partial [Xanthomonas campestris]